MSPGTARRHASLAARITVVSSLVFGLAACAVESPTAPPAATRAAVAAVANGVGPKACNEDSKLIGLIELSNADVPGTWWYITRKGMDEAGITDYLTFINSVFGSEFADLEEASAAIVDAVRLRDLNGNGLVCAYSIRGTRASSPLPDPTRYTFAVSDDRPKK